MNQLDYIDKLIVKCKLRIDKLDYRKNEIFAREHEIIQNIESLNKDITPLQPKSKGLIINNKKREKTKLKIKYLILMLFLITILILLKETILFYPFLCMTLGSIFLKSMIFRWKRKEKNNSQKGKNKDNEESLIPKKLKKENLIELLDNLVVEKNVLIQEENYLFGLINSLEQYKMKLVDNKISDNKKINDEGQKVRERRKNNGKNI